jgi:hypothetical protein
LAGRSLNRGGVRWIIVSRQNTILVFSINHSNGRRIEGIHNQWAKSELFSPRTDEELLYWGPLRVCNKHCPSQSEALLFNSAIKIFDLKDGCRSAPLQHLRPGGPDVFRPRGNGLGAMRLLTSSRGLNPVINSSRCYQCAGGEVMPSNPTTRTTKVPNPISKRTFRSSKRRGLFPGR